jgi:hypothetical protein
MGKGLMPYRKCQAGDTVVVRAFVLEACSDAFQVRFEGDGMTFTTWVPASECALIADVGDLKPIRRANPRHIDR